MQMGKPTFALIMVSILHVDDHPVSLACINTIIHGVIPKVTIDEIYRGDEALEKIKANDYDLVLLDVSMPGIDSFDLVKEILQLKPQTKISMLTMHEESYY